MIYVLTLRLDDPAHAQAWIENTFDLSFVTTQYLGQSPFRGEMLAKVSVAMEDWVVKPFDDALDRLRNLWPEKDRILLHWTKES